MRRVMVAVWGKDASKYVGRSMKLFRDPDVTWGGMKVGGIRISHMSGMEKPEIMALTATQKQRKPYRVDPLVIEEAAPKVDEVALGDARAAARKGTEGFRKWFKVNPDKRDAAKSIMPELQKIASDADATSADDEDPFGLPPLKDDTKPTEEEMARAQEEARQASLAQETEGAQ